MELRDTTPEFNTAKRQFAEFLHADEGQGRYAQLVKKMLEHNKSRLILNINDLRSFVNEDVIGEPLNLGERLLNQPMDMIPAFEEGLKEHIDTYESPDVPLKTSQRYFVGAEGSFGSHLVVPRELNASLLTKLVCIEGIVTKLSLVRPKIVKSVHFCEKTEQFHNFTYRDATSFTGAPTSGVLPKKDSEGNDLSTEFGLSLYTDHQKLFVQDMPERSAAGQMPRTVEVIVESDLVDCCKPGDRVQVIGVYRALAHRAEGTTSGMYKTACIANHVRTIGQTAKEEILNEKDIENIRNLAAARRDDLFELFSRSLASTLYGHEYIKKALLLLLFGGVEKTLENGTHLRGDVNMLLVGDPSVGKSQLLRCVMHVAKLAISTTGRGATGVGLTAAVSQDKDTGERYLEAGAMVLADRGVVCIDEFDKMSIVDRTSMHEVMEQQTVTIAKAGIHTSLNARCSVVAAANPIYGSYDTSKPPQKNIPLPDSILSRFDFLFIVLDKLDPTQDRFIAEHVLRMHRFQSKESDLNEHDIYEVDDADKEDVGDTEIFQKYDRLLHGASVPGRPRLEYLTLDFIKKYIDYAKKRYKPVLTDEASEFIANSYGELRTKEEVQTLPITARCLETMIRLATAHAKLRLSKHILRSDVEAALEVLQYSLNNEAQIKSRPKPKKKLPKSDSFSGDDTESDSDSDGDSDDDKKDVDVEMEMEKEEEEKEEDETVSQKRAREDKDSPPGSPQPSQKRQKLSDTLPSGDSLSPSKDDGSSCPPPAEAAMDTTPLPVVGVSKEKKSRVMKTITKIWKRTRKDEMLLDSLFEEVNKDTSDPLIIEELEVILKELEDDNRLMFRKDMIRRI